MNRFVTASKDSGTLSWAEVKKRLSGKSEKELMSLLGECYKTSPDVRVRLSLTVSSGRGENRMIISDLGKRLHTIFWTCEKNGRPRDPDLKEARNIISLAKRSTDDPVVLVDLILDHLEHGVGFTMEYGDLWENYYISIENEFERTCEYIAAHRSEIDVDTALARIDRQIHMTRNIGWGFEEALDGIRDELVERLGE